MKKHYYISALQRNGKPSYLVRVPQFKNGVPYHNYLALKSKYFSMVAFGTEKKALAAAIKWRDQYFINNGMPLNGRDHKYVNRVHHTSSKNKSGVIGVALRLNNDKTNREYRATWTVEGENGKSTNKYEIFVCGVHGIPEAFELACIIRWENAKPQRPLMVVNEDAMPCEPPVPYILKNKEG